MEERNLDNAREILEYIQETETKGMESLPFSLLNRATNKTTKLAANSNNVEPMNGANRWFEYEFTEPVFLSEVVVSTADYSPYDRFNFRWKTEAGATVEEVARIDEGNFKTTVNQLVRKVSFKPPKKYLGTQKISDVDGEEQN